MTSADPKVSVVIPLYNKRDYIARTIRSALVQHGFADYEIIVVDDGSTDGSDEIANSFEHRIRYVWQPNQGPSTARNRGIEAALGEFVAFLDADDEWLPTKLASQMSYLEQHPTVVWSSTNWLISRVGKSKPLLATPRDANKNWVTLENWFSEHTGYNPKMLTSGVIVRSDVLREAGGFDPEIPAGQDTDLWLRIAEQHPTFGFCYEPQFRYFANIPDSISRGGEGRLRSFLRMQEKHIARLSRSGANEAYRKRIQFSCRRLIYDALKYGHPQVAQEMIRALPPDWITWRERIWNVVAFFPPCLLVCASDVRLRVKKTLGPLFNSTTPKSMSDVN